MKNIADFINFRKLCLANAEAAIVSAEGLQHKNANHIAYHLSTLALEEIGKIYIAWFNFNRSQKSEDNEISLTLDDHTKKIFWAFWWETFGKEIPTQEQINDNKSLASKIHQRRLQSLYTEITDVTPASDKIPDDELENIIGLVRARLEIAKEDEVVDREESEEIKTFMRLTDDPEKRSFIFGEEAQNKLIESGDVKVWVTWLIERFEKESKELDNLLENELKRPITFNESEDTPKWKIKIKIISPLHSIRQNVLTEYNKTSDMFKLNKGGDKNTLIIDIILNKHTSAATLWHYGYLVSRMYVTSLNIASNGVFWWHTNVDLDKFYESIKDLESNKKFGATLITKLHWPESKSILTLQNLQLAKLANSYMVKYYNKPQFEPFFHYMTTISMMAKNDIHLRFEPDMFMILFDTYKKTIIKNQAVDENGDFKGIGYYQISGMIKGQDYYDNIIEMGEAMSVRKTPSLNPVTLTEVLAIKNYLGIYLLTLAVRDYKDDNTLRLTNMEEPIEDIPVL